MSKLNLEIEIKPIQVDIIYKMAVEINGKTEIRDFYVTTIDYSDFVKMAEEKLERSCGQNRCAGDPKNSFL